MFSLLIIVILAGTSLAWLLILGAVTTIFSTLADLSSGVGLVVSSAPMPSDAERPASQHRDASGGNPFTLLKVNNAKAED